MIFGQRLKEKRLEKKLGVNQLALKSGVSSAQISRFENGKRKSPSIETAEKLAKALDVSLNYLVGNNKESEEYYSLSNKEKNDIAIQADKLLEGIESGENLNFYGEPATPEQKERIRVALRTAMEMNKEEAKKKFTPKKYRDRGDSDENSREEGSK